VTGEAAQSEVLVATASQTVGPFFQIGMAHLNEESVGDADARDDAVSVSGRILDGNGDVVCDAVMEVWAATDARHDDSGCSWAFARVVPQAGGTFHFRVQRPPGTESSDGSRHAPTIWVLLFMRGLLKPLLTRLYFPNEPANDHDPVMSLVAGPRRATLIARAGSSSRLVEWDVRLQGDHETVFFEW